MSLAEVRKIVKDGSAVFGSEQALKRLKTGTAKKIFLAKNCQASVKESIQHYAKIAEVDVEQLDEPNDELALICKKPFSVSVISY